MERVIALAQIIPCPNGWDEYQCYDDGRELNPCGSYDQHCLGNGTAVQLIPPRGPEYTEAAFDIFDEPCGCGPEQWTHRLEGGDGGAGVSVWACDICRVPKAAVIAAGWGTCKAVPR